MSKNSSDDYTRTSYHLYSFYGDLLWVSADIEKIQQLSKEEYERGEKPCHIISNTITLPKTIKPKNTETLQQAISKALNKYRKRKVKNDTI